MATATAAGFKKCFLPTANIYFDAMATTAATAKNRKLLNALGGLIIKAIISAVIYTDSILLGALNAQAKTALEKMHTAVMKAVETTRSSGPKASSLNKLR